MIPFLGKSPQFCGGKSRGGGRGCNVVRELSAVRGPQFANVQDWAAQY